MAAVSSRDRQSAVLTDALLGIVGDRGLDRVSVREVAAAAGVSIGTVQHYFPTMDAMLAAAFSEVVRRTRARIAAIPLDGDVRNNLARVLGELLPLDEVRAEESRVQIAFAARATTSDELAAIQRGTLTEVTRELTGAFTAAGVAAGPDAVMAARLALAATDGLALHAASSGRRPPPAELTAALDQLVAALLPDPAPPRGGPSQERSPPRG